MDDVIAIDGPAGAGKSTIAKLVAKKLSYAYIDTGAMYRALTLKAIRNSVDLKDETALIELAKKTSIDIKNDKSGELLVFLDGEDVEGKIRVPELTNKVFYVAKIEGVREQMVKLQRKIGSARRCVFEGRDITTVVFPNSRYKFYLDASLQERAKRRHKDLTQLEGKASGKNSPAVSLNEVQKDIEIRDHSDKVRKAGPLRMAEDAICIDTTNMSIEEVVDRVCSYIK